MKKILLLVLLAFTLSNGVLRSETPHLILISLDGFRWDYANRGITPNLDIIRKEGVSALSFKPSFPTSTFPNHFSIITGMYPQNHGIILNYFENHLSEIYKLGDDKAVSNPKWYLGEPFWESAKRHHIKTASYYWPGSEMTDENRRPDFFKAYNHKEPHATKIDGVINWLSLPYSERPKFITLYFHDTDSDGHKFGTDSKEVNATISTLDSLIGVLRNRIALIGMKDSVNLIILSDHGMTDVSESRVIDLKTLLEGFDCKVNDMSAFAMIKPKNQADCDAIYKKLKQNENKFKVYKREEMPDYFHFSSNAFLYDLMVVPETGWSIKYRSKGYSTNAEHGYDNNELDMHGIFFAVGNKFKQNYRVGTLNNIDVYPLLCEIFGVIPRSNIDGKAERIRFILK